MRRGVATAILLLAAVLPAAGCRIVPVAAEHRQRSALFPTIEEAEEPAGLIQLSPAVSNPIDCPHCGEVNRLGQSACRKCGQPLSLVPVKEPCGRCGGDGLLDDSGRCEVCQGSGWIEARRDPGASP